MINPITAPITDEPKFSLLPYGIIESRKTNKPKTNKSRNITGMSFNPNKIEDIIIEPDKKPFNNNFHSVMGVSTSNILILFIFKSFFNFF